MGMPAAPRCLQFTVTVVRLTHRNEERRNPMNQVEMVTVQTPSCTVCSRTSRLSVPRPGLELWRAGAYIQDVLPALTADEREMLLTGTHPDCWDRLWSTDGGDDE